MKKIAPEIDSIMWGVVESGDLKAIEEFEARYPDHRYELGRRLAMVRALKNQRPDLTKREHAPPPLRVSPAARPSAQRTTSPLHWVLASVALCSLAYGSFIVSKGFFAQKETPVVQAENPGTGDSMTTQPERNTTPEPPLIVENTPAVEIDQPKETEKLFTARFDRLRLSEALDYIATEGGIDLEILPGLKDFDIALDYRDSSAFTMLQDMGRNFGFTVLRQEGNKVMIVPAVDSGQSSPNSPDDWNKSNSPSDSSGSTNSR